MEDCLFCKIIAGNIPAVKIYEDEHALAFLDINPNNHGHTLIVPKKHFKNMLEVPAEEFALLAPAMAKVSKAVFKGMDAIGLNINVNNERPAGQIIFHLHIHIIPRFEGDRLRVWSRNVSYKDGEMEEVAVRIQNALDNI